MVEEGRSGPSLEATLSLPPADPRGRPLLGALGRTPVVSVVATSVDMLVLLALVELLGWHYTTGTAAGAVVGAAVHFGLSRHWVFLAGDGRLRDQLPLYGLVVASSIVLNTSLVWLFTEHGGLPYPLSRLFAAAFVAFGHNFPLMRWVVFRPRDATE